jgi:hypothetical protein
MKGCSFTLEFWTQAEYSKVRGPLISFSNAVTKELTQNLHYLICCMRHGPILLKPAVLLVSFKKGSEILTNFLPKLSR